jgi:hypothetical protein
MSSTQVKPKTITFISKGPNLYLERVPPEVRYVSQGGSIKQLVDKPGVVYETRNGSFTVAIGQDVLPTYYGPQVEGQWFKETDKEEEDAVEWLRRHPEFGDRFFEQPQEAPDAEDVFLEIGKAEATKDLDKLNEIAEFELQNWNRERVMEACRDAYEAITGGSEAAQEGTEAK